MTLRFREEGINFTVINEASVFFWPSILAQTSWWGVKNYPILGQDLISKANQR